jgi:hypothetical protein
VKRHLSYYAAAVVGLSLLAGPVHFRETVHAQEEQDVPVPVVFQAAGPTVASIQGMVDAFRAALGASNGNTPGPLATGRREINWDGGGSTATSITPSTFDGFLLSRGARFVTSGEGFVQAPVAGLATTFNNPTYETIFQAFSPVRLFSPIGRNVMSTLFFVPGSGVLPAETRGFGAIFTDVDRPNLTSISYHAADKSLLFRGFVPASSGDKSVSFLGVVFHNPIVFKVNIRTGRSAPGGDDTLPEDVVMMDDFIYAEPQMVD